MLSISLSLFLYFLVPSPCHPFFSNLIFSCLLFSCYSLPSSRRFSLLPVSLLEEGTAADHHRAPVRAPERQKQAAYRQEEATELACTRKKMREREKVSAVSGQVVVERQKRKAEAK